MTTNQKALRNLGIAALCFIAFLLFKAWTDARFNNSVPTATERTESWRQQKLESARAKNYVENIKPHIPVE